MSRICLKTSSHLTCESFIVVLKLLVRFASTYIDSSTNLSSRSTIGS
jgi:hypothetical protein